MQINFVFVYVNYCPAHTVHNNVQMLNITCIKYIYTFIYNFIHHSEYEYTCVWKIC